MSNIKLDLKMFKHLKSDDKTTTLQHKQGHTLTLAHKNLSKEAQEQLGQLAKISKQDSNPGDKAESKEDSQTQMASGGEVAESNPKLEQSKKEPPPRKVPKSEIKYEDKPDKGQGAIKHKLAEGGAVKEPTWCKCDKMVGDNPSCTMHPHKKQDQQPRKMYADPQEEVSQNDPAPTALPAPQGPLQGIPADAANVALQSAGLAPQQPAASPMLSPVAAPAASSQGDIEGEDQRQEEGGGEKDKAPASKSAASSKKSPKDIPDDLQKDVPLSPEQSQMGVAGAQDTAAAQTGASSPEQYAQNFSQDLKNEAQAVMADYGNGHIQPKNYHDLWANKSTLGKIGTIFGLIVGGAGAGLAGGNNPMLEMMDKEIGRDLEAQKSSKEGQLNFVKVAQQQELNDQQIQNMVQSGQLTKAEASNVRAEAALKANALARINANIHAFQTLAKQANSYPKGSKQWQDAQNTLAVLYQGMDAQNSNLSDRAAAAAAALRFGGVGNEEGSEQEFSQKNKALSSGLLGPTGEKMAVYNMSHHLADIPGLSNAAIPDGKKEEILAMNTLDNRGQDLLKFIKENKGSWNPKKQAQAEQKVEEMKNFYNGSIEGGALTKGRLAWYDEQFAHNPLNVIKDMLGSTKKFEEVINSNSTRRDLALHALGLKAPKGYNTSAPVSSGNQAPEGHIITSKDGKVSQIKQNGVWKPYKASGK